MTQLKNMPNPQLGLYNMLVSNPQYRSFINLMQMGSGNWQQAAQTIANQQGIDLNSLIQQLQN